MLNSLEVDVLMTVTNGTGQTVDIGITLIMKHILIAKLARKRLQLDIRPTHVMIDYITKNMKILVNLMQFMH